VRKYLRPISKYKAHILKYVPCIFHFLRGVRNVLKMSTHFPALKTDIYGLAALPCPCGSCMLLHGAAKYGTIALRYGLFS